MKAFWSFVGFLIIVLLCAWFLSQYVWLTEEERVLRVLEKGRRAVEAGSVYSVSSILDGKYMDASGLDRASVLRVLQDFFNDTEQRKVRFGLMNIQIEGNQAQVDISFQLQAQLENRFSPYQRHLSEAERDMKKLRVTLIKERKNWLITHTDHSLRDF